MTFFAICLQVLTAAGIFNVWVVRRNRATPFRPDGAASIAEEFRRYGLPDWALTVVGATKLTLAALLVVGIWFAPVAVVAAGVLSLFMVSAVVAHVRVRDHWFKAVPALVMLLMSTLVVLARTV